MSTKVYMIQAKSSLILITFLITVMISSSLLNGSDTTVYAQTQSSITTKLPGMTSSSVSTATATTTNDNRPNFLLIMGDDFGYSDIGSFGSEISTPNLDTLAKDRKIFTNYHTAATCSPARLSLLTGVDYHIGGLGTMFELIAPNQKGKPGYETYINNKVVTVA